MLGHRVRYLLRASDAIRDLRKSQARLASAQRIAQLGHWEWHVATDDVQCSEEILRILRRSPQKWSDMRQAFLDNVHPDDRAVMEDALDSAVRAQRPCKIDLRMAGPDSSVRTVHAQIEVTQDHSGKLVLLQGTVQDVTEQKAAEEEIRVSECRYRRLFETAQDGILILDAETAQIVDACSSFSISGCAWRSSLARNACLSAGASRASCDF
jgi:PAS domain-containing protein